MESECVICGEAEPVAQTQKGYDPAQQMASKPDESSIEMKEGNEGNKDPTQADSSQANSSSNHTSIANKESALKKRYSDMLTVFAVWSVIIVLIIVAFILLSYVTPPA